MVPLDEEVRSLAPRNRRASAPPMCADQGSVVGKTFKTTLKATVRTMPSAVSMKISELPEGWKVVAAESETPCPGWIALEPRGYVLEKELEPASPRPAPREVLATEQVEPRSVCGQKTRSARHSGASGAATGPLAAAGPLLRKGSRASVGSSGTPPQNVLPARSATARQCQSPRSGCTSPHPRYQGGAVRAVKPMLSPRQGLQARQSPRQCGNSSSASATPSPQAPKSWLCASSAKTTTPEALEVLALKEEQVHLRERNVDLAEKEVERRRELEELAVTREAIAREVQQLQRSRSELKEQHDTTQKELEKQEEKMKEKLVRARNVVAKAVGSIDELYAVQDTSARLSTSTSLNGSDCIVATDDIHHERDALKAIAQEAGAEVSLLLDTWDPDQENTETATITTKKLPEEDLRSERAPLGDCNTVF